MSRPGRSTDYNAFSIDNAEPTPSAAELQNEFASHAFNYDNNAPGPDNGERYRPPRSMSAVGMSHILKVPELRNQFQLNIDDDTGEFVVAAPTRGKQPKASGSLSSGRRANQSRTMDALLGQAALESARGNDDKAIAVLHDIIRQDPRKPHAYRQIAEICENRQQVTKCFQYRLFACYVDRTSSADDWDQVGDMAIHLKKYPEAVASFLKAIRIEPQVWIYFHKRIEILERMQMKALAMKTRLMAMESVDLVASNLSFHWFENMMQGVIEYFTLTDESDKANKALMCYVIRCLQRGIDITENILVLTYSLLLKDRHIENVNLILGCVKGISAIGHHGQPAYKIEFNPAHSTVHITPFPLQEVDKFYVHDTFPTILLGRLILSLIYTRNEGSILSLIEVFIERIIETEHEDIYMAIGTAYDTIKDYHGGLEYAKLMIDDPVHSRLAHSWFLYGLFLERRNEPLEALAAYETVLQCDYRHVDARINMSWILQELDRNEEALEVVKGYSLEGGQRLPNERLLIRQAQVFLDRGYDTHYMNTLRMLLIPHFYVVHLEFENILRKRRTLANKAVHVNLRRTIMGVISRSPLERLVNKYGAIAERDERSLETLTPEQLHEYSMKLIHFLSCFEQQKQELLHVVCYVFLHPRMPAHHIETTQNILFYAAIKGENFGLAFEFLRYLQITTRVVDDLDDAQKASRLKQIYLAMNFVFCHHQTVAYQRYVTRLITKFPDEIMLHTMCGNNALMAGSYKTAIYEYSISLKMTPEDPLLNLNIALCFTNLASRKDITNRTALAIRAVAFMNAYKTFRLRAGPKQEVWFNIGRMFNQLGMNTFAVHWYEKVFDEPLPSLLAHDPTTGDASLIPADIYDMRPLAALNLIQIIKDYNPQKARTLRRKYCVL